MRSFTSALVEELEAFKDTPFTVAMLHARLVTIRWRLKYTPIYTLLSEHGGNSIAMIPLPRHELADMAELDSVPQTASNMDADNSSRLPALEIPTIDTRVLLSISVVGDAARDINEWTDWLTTAVPSDVLGVDVSIHSIFESTSILVVLSLPTYAWDRLPARPAYRFIGFVKSQDLFHAPASSTAPTETFPSLAMDTKTSNWDDDALTPSTVTDSSDLKSSFGDTIKSNPWADYMKWLQPESNLSSSTWPHDQDYSNFPVTSDRMKNSIVGVPPQDLITAADVGLGDTWLALQAFAGCIKGTQVKKEIYIRVSLNVGYQLFLRVRDMPSEYHYLRIRLRIEQERLLNWGERVGLEEERLKQPSGFLQYHGNRIIKTMIEVQKTFRESVKINPLPRATETGTGDTLGTDTMLKKTLKFLEMVPSKVSRLTWAMVKNDTFKGLVEKLIDYNTYIENLLDNSAVEQLISKRQRSYMTILQLHNDVTELKEISLAMYLKTDSSPPGSGSKISSSWYSDTFEHYGNGTKFARLAEFKSIQISLLDSSLDIEPIDRMKIDIEELDDDPRTVGVYHSQHIWIEWKYYDLANLRHIDWDDQIQLPIKRLAILLGSDSKLCEFGAPQCLGYFNDTDSNRYGLLYKKPIDVPPSTKPISLLDLLHPETQPSLSKRITLAHAIARCLMYLHSVNWLHRDLRSDNIIFFAPDGTTPAYYNPIIAGFEFARPGLREEMTDRPPNPTKDDVYQHPDILRGLVGSRALKSHDIYSLGVILVEIAYWAPLSDILRLPTYPRGLRRVKDTLLTSEFLRGIQNHAGESYASVVRRCLAGGVELGIPKGADENDSEIGVHMQSVLTEEIVMRLSNIKI